MSALRKTAEDDCYTRAANEDYINGGPRTRTKYTYDGNGNAVSRNGSIIGWTSYNYPSSVASSVESATFQYGPDRQRWKTIYTSSVGTETTYHVGKLLEKVANGGTLDYRHYIFAGSELVGIYSRQSTGTNTMRYVLGDHQSSFSGILSSTGTLDVGESFAAFGNRRYSETWSGAPTNVEENTINGISRQGYTGQTALGVSMGLIHMNGRIEDAITGRFLSPDPTIPDPGNTQSFNRYSYVNNNPLSRVDPTGFDDLPDDPITVTGYKNGSSPYSNSDGIGFDFFDFSPFTFLTKYQLQAIAAGLANPKVLRGLPSAAQTSADNGFSYAVSADGATRGPQVVGDPSPYASNTNGLASDLGDINKPIGADQNGGSSETAQSQNSMLYQNSTQNQNGVLPAGDCHPVCAAVTVTGQQTTTTGNNTSFIPQPISVPILPELEPYMQARSPRFRCTAPGCGAPHGGLRGNYCPECWGKSQDPNGGVPPDPNAPDDEDYPEQGSNPANQGQYKVPSSSWAVYFLLGGFITWLLGPN
jgi:RHS repeat-associated protein